MKKILSLVLVTVMVMSLSIPAFADKPAWAGNNKEEKVEKELPKGLQDKAVIPYGHRKDQVVSVDEIEKLIEDVRDYIETLDTDSDDDGLPDEDGDEEVDVIDLEAAEDIALGGRNGHIVKMMFDDAEYSFEFWYADKLHSAIVDGVTEDVTRDVLGDELDLTDVISYDDAKAAALEEVEEVDEVDEADGKVISLELDLEEVETGEDPVGSYEIKVLTDIKTYTVEIDAYDGVLIDIDPEAIDEEDDEEADEEGDDMVSAIENLIDRIEYEILKSEEERSLGHFMFQLEKKFHVLQKIYGEAPEKEDYTEDLKELKASLEDIKDDSVFNDDEKEAIQDLIDEIQEDLDALDTDEFISEDVYEDFEDDADMYFDMLEDEVESDEVEDLVAEIRDFVLDNEFGSNVGEYSQEEALELLGLFFEKPSIDEEDLDDYYKDLKLSYKKFKMSKLVAGDYLETLVDYKADLVALEDGDLTDDESSLKYSLIETIEGLNENGKVSLGTFYELESDALSLLGDTVEDPEDYEEALDEKIDEVREAIFASYEDVDQVELRTEKILLLGHYFQGVEDQNNAETEAEFIKAYDKLNAALIAFNDFLK